MKKLIYYIILNIIINSYSVFCQFPEFQYSVIGSTDELSGQTSLVDVDKDGDLDWIVGTADTIWWFEYQGADHWIKHILGLAPATETGGIALDVDGDGFVDQVSGGTWYKNPGDPGKMWTKFSSKAIPAHECISADINNDGKPDVVMMNDTKGIYWYDFSAAPTKAWKGTRIGDGVRSGIGPVGCGDIDEDGDIDIVRTNIWFENQNNGSRWIPHLSLKMVVRDLTFPNSSKAWVIDMDKDGDADIVQAESYVPDSKVIWSAKMDKRGNTWYVNNVDLSTQQEIQSLAVADFDNDGDPDIFVGGSTRTKDFHKRSFIYENLDGMGKQWKKHEILVDQESFDARAGDVDGDGDIDIVGKPWHGANNYYLRNMLTELKQNK